MRIIVSLIYIIISLTLCGQRAFTEEQLQYEFPKKPVKYKLSKTPFSLTDTLIVSSKAIYIGEFIEEEWENYEVVKRSNSYTFMRFFNDGRVFISFAYLSYPSVKEFNDLSYGKYGRYLLKDGEIIIEFYQNRQYGVMFMFAKPVLTGVQFYATAYKMNPLVKNKSTDGGYYKKDY
jgi:hypothetical protein